VSRASSNVAGRVVIVSEATAGARLTIVSRAIILSSSAGICGVFVQPRASLEEYRT
jgi:hypothetical protein